MTKTSMRLLYWAPRVLSIVFIVFLSMFALDVFGEVRGFWNVLVALSMHLIPSFVLLIALILAWHWEWIGTLIFAAAGTLYVVMTLRLAIRPGLKLIWIAGIAGPAFVMAVLFLIDWLMRGELHPRKS